MPADISQPPPPKPPMSVGKFSDASRRAVCASISSWSIDDSASASSPLMSLLRE